MLNTLLSQEISRRTFVSAALALVFVSRETLCSFVATEKPTEIHLGYIRSIAALEGTQEFEARYGRRALLLDADGEGYSEKCERGSAIAEIKEGDCFVLAGDFSRGEIALDVNGVRWPIAQFANEAEAICLVTGLANQGIPVVAEARIVWRLGDLCFSHFVFEMKAYATGDDELAAAEQVACSPVLRATEKTLQEELDRRKRFEMYFGE